MKEKEINFSVGAENLKGKLFLHDDSKKCDIISLHGAGQSTKERIEYLLNDLALHLSFNAGTFDFSGHGESSGTMEGSSLKKRVDEASAFIKEYATPNPTIIGTSMGGYIAVKLLEVLKPKTLILFCPALYSGDAYPIPFTSQFSDIIRKPNSWVQTDVLPLLENFEGNLLLFIGAKDQIIPAGVIDLIEKHSGKVAKKEIIRIPDGPHGIHGFIDERPPLKKEVVAKILEYITA